MGTGLTTGDVDQAVVEIGGLRERNRQLSIEEGIWHATEATLLGRIEALKDQRDLVAVIKRAKEEALAGYPFHVYPGSEKLDLGPKGEPQALCRSRGQAEYMAKFWGEAGYVEEVK